MAFSSKPVVSGREYELVTALVKAGASPKKGVLKRGELSIHPPALYQSLRTKGVLATETEGHGRGAKTTVRLLLEPDQLEFSKRGTKAPAASAASTPGSRKPTVEEMVALCELIAREERLAEAAAAPEPGLLRELDTIKAAFTAAIAANDVARPGRRSHREHVRRARRFPRERARHRRRLQLDHRQRDRLSRPRHRRHAIRVRRT